MSRPEALDTFCGEGGTGMGLRRAGFNVTGVDNDDARLARYPFPHVKADALPPAACSHPAGIQCAGAYGGARRDKWEAKRVRKGGYVPKSLDVLRELVGAPWMSEKGCFLSIPPAYTEHIGAQILEHLAVSA